MAWGKDDEWDRWGLQESEKWEKDEEIEGFWTFLASLVIDQPAACMSQRPSLQESVRLGQESDTQPIKHFPWTTNFTQLSAASLLTK